MSREGRPPIVNPIGGLSLNAEQTQSPVLDSTIAQAVYRGSYDTSFFARMTMPEIFSHPMTAQHREAWKLIDDETVPRTVISCWRGFGKSTQNFAKALQAICYRQRRYIIWIGSTFDNAAKWTENIKMELLHNPVLLRLFGRMYAKRYEGLEVGFSKKDWFWCDPLTGEPLGLVMPRGMEQEVRGTNVRIGNQLCRPDLLFIDDPENQEDIDNEETRKKQRRWFFGTFMKLVDTKVQSAKDGFDTRSKTMVKRYGPNYQMSRFIYVDTLKHEDSLMAHLLESPSWKRVSFAIAEIANKDFKNPILRSLVPEIISDKRVNEELREARENNAVAEFYREMMGVAVPPEQAVFQKADRQYYNEVSYRINRDQDWCRFVILEPARTTNPRSAFTAIGAIAVSAVRRQIMIRKVINERMSPSDYHKAALDLCIETNSRLLAAELTGQDDALSHPLMNLASTRNIPVQFLWLDPHSKGSDGDYGTGKEAIKRARAGTLIPYYQGHQVWHNVELRDSVLEAQMSSYPRPRFWDALDMASYIPQVMAKLEIYFEAAPPKLSDKIAVARFEDETETVFWDQLIRSGAWRTV